MGCDDVGLYHPFLSFLASPWGCFIMRFTTFIIPVWSSHCDCRCVYIYIWICVCVCVWFDLRMVAHWDALWFSIHIHRHRCLSMVRSTRNWPRLLGQFQLLKLRALSDADRGDYVEGSSSGKGRWENHDFFGKFRSGINDTMNSVFERGNTIDFNNVRGKRMIFINDNIW